MFQIDAGDENLKEHIQICTKNATHVSWKIQNKIVSTCNDLVLQKILPRVNSAKCFSVLADETTDISTTGKLSLFTLCG
jgi:hypothetical protein